MGKEFHHAAATLQHLKSTGRLAIIDASLQENHGLVDSAKVEGYPAFLLYRNARHVLSYGGLRTESHFVEYMLQQTAPLVTSVSTLEEMIGVFRSHFDPSLDAGREDDTPDIAHYFFVGMVTATSGESSAKMDAYRQLMEDVSAHNDNTRIHFLFTG